MPWTVHRREAEVLSCRKRNRCCQYVLSMDSSRGPRWTPEPSHCWRGGGQAVTGPGDSLGSGRHGESPAPGSPPPHQRSHSPGRRYSPGWRQPGMHPCTPGWTRRGYTVGRARTCPAVGGQPGGKGVRERPSQCWNFAVVEHPAGQPPRLAHSFPQKGSQQCRQAAPDFQVDAFLHCVMPYLRPEGVSPFLWGSGPATASDTSSEVQRALSTSAGFTVDAKSRRHCCSPHPDSEKRHT